MSKYFIGQGVGDISTKMDPQKLRQRGHLPGISHGNLWFAAWSIIDSYVGSLMLTIVQSTVPFALSIPFLPLETTLQASQSPNDRSCLSAILIKSSGVALSYSHDAIDKQSL